MSLRQLKMQVMHGMKSALFYGGAFSVLRKLKPNPDVSILRYHAVVAPHENDYANPTICISPRAFENHVRYFTRHFAVLSLNEVVAALQSGHPLPSNAVVFTFDDGYADNLEAARILHRYGASGTFYLTAACIDRQEPFWLSELIYTVLRTRKPAFMLEIDGVIRETFILQGLTRKQRWVVIETLVGLIKSHNRTVRETIRRQLRNQLNDADFETAHDRIILNWKQVQEMIHLGMTIGGHTLTHLNLPNAEPADARMEIVECKSLLEARVGEEVLHFSYPNSGPYRYFTESIREMVQQAGYHSAATSSQGFVGTGADCFAMHRVRTVPSLVETVAGLELARLPSTNGSRTGIVTRHQKPKPQTT